MSTDTSPPRTQATAATALVKLLVRTEHDPAIGPLLPAVTWTISMSARVTGSFYHYGHRRDAGAEFLQAARSLLGGEISSTLDRYDSDYAWHILSTTVAGVPVTLKAPVASASVEAQLRQRIRELEAAAAAPTPA
ncbi:MULTISPECIES: hypothetical protein [Streptomyces]|uniref:Uncharacterized protein n=1 Tax=Streptomyces erythrochromogenes TaxID=285574 RepID=A0ABZ1QFA0_9ACTN|nr:MULTISPECIES: hypothetical protein [Streptomyces]